MCSHHDDDPRYDEWEDEAREDDYWDSRAREEAREVLTAYVAGAEDLYSPQWIDQAAVVLGEADVELTEVRDEDGAADVIFKFSILPATALEIAGRQYQARAPVRSVRVVRRPHRSHLRARRTRRVRSRSGSRGSPPRSADDPPLASRPLPLSARRAA